MPTYDFTLKFSLHPDDENMDDLVEQLAGAGCDDGLIGMGQPGRIALNFTRDASSAYDAMTSAIRDIKKVIPKAKLVEATPDFVGLTDVAELLNVSRQYMRKLMTSEPTFPSPIHEGNPALWHLATLLQWLKEQKNYQVNDDIVEVAKTTKQFNLAKELIDIERSQHDAISRLIA